MLNWNFNSNDYTARNFAPIPEGNHRVRITNVAEKVFNSGKEGLEISFDVSGYNSKLWLYLVLDPMEPAKTNQRLGMFFDSFDIKDHNLTHYNNWIGLDGAVRVRHNNYQGEIKANVAFCLSRSQQDKMPQWQNGSRGDSSGCDIFSNVQPAAPISRPPMSFDGVKF